VGGEQRASGTSDKARQDKGGRLRKQTNRANFDIGFFSIFLQKAFGKDFFAKMCYGVFEVSLSRTPPRRTSKTKTT
jgi:hypothetical protein